MANLVRTSGLVHVNGRVIIPATAEVTNPIFCALFSDFGFCLPHYAQDCYTTATAQMRPHERRLLEHACIQKLFNQV
jgi:hypothetical protein